MKKGFTLIELIAVIVLIAIIAIIATPIILGVIKDSKISAFKNSAYGVYNGTRDYFFIKNSQSDNTNILPVGALDPRLLKLSGKYPDSGLAIINTNKNIGLYVYDSSLKMCGLKNYNRDDFIFIEDMSKEDCSESLEQPTYLDDIVKVGDYVEYDAGNWTSTVPYASLTTQGQFGGYTSGNSRNQGIACESSGAIVADRVGWRVIDIDSGANVVSLISAGTPECYYHNTDTAYSISTLASHDYSYYVNSDIADSAGPFTQTLANKVYNSTIAYDIDLVSKDVLLSGSRYFFPITYNSTYLLYAQPGGWVGAYRYVAYGIRPVVNLKPNLYVNSGSGILSNKYIASTTYTAPIVNKRSALITGYWQNWNSSDTINLKLRDVPQKYDIVNLAFGFTSTGSAKGVVNFSVDSYLSTYLGGYTEQNLKDDIKILHLRGQKVLLSIGGAGNTIVVDDEASVNNFVNSTYALIQNYDLNGIDINFEGGLNPNYLASAINSLASLVGEDFLLTMAPQTDDFKVNSSGVVSGDYYSLITQVKDLITIVNMQMYNSGTQYGLDGNIYTQGTVDFVTALSTILLEKGLSPSQVGIGIHHNSSSDGYMIPANFVSAYESLTKGGVTMGGTYIIPKAYPDFGGFMIWSINGDVSLNNTFSSAFDDKLKTN